MSTHDDGGPAFPSSNCPDTGYYAEGMTLRDYFAAKALLFVLEDQPSGFEFAERCASEAYRLADAMLKARGP